MTASMNQMVTDGFLAKQVIFRGVLMTEFHTYALYWLFN